MSASVNEVRLVGNLGADPVITKTPGGHSVCTISLATSFKRGEVERTEWHRVVLWKGLADRTQMMRKGTSVWISGRIETRKWDKDGEAQYTTEIVADNLQILSGWREDSKGARASDMGSVAHQDGGKRGEPPQSAGYGLDDDDAPF